MGPPVDSVNRCLKKVAKNGRYNELVHGGYFMVLVNQQTKKGGGHRAHPVQSPFHPIFIPVSSHWILNQQGLLNTSEAFVQLQREASCSLAQLVPFRRRALARRAHRVGKRPQGPATSYNPTKMEMMLSS